jgi:hypothetical protein
MKMEFLAEASPDCPLIRLYDFQTRDALELKNLFDSLADGTRTAIALHEQSFIEPIDGCRLNLRVGIRDTGIVQTGPFTFEGRLTPARWSDVAGLSEPFCVSAEPNRFQWLNEDSKISLLLSPDGMW